MSLRTRRIWPSRIHPNPDQVQAGHTIVLHDDTRVTITGVGWANGDGTTVCSTLTDQGQPALIRWDPSDSRWHPHPWTATTSTAG